MRPESFLVPCGDNTTERLWSTMLLFSSLFLSLADIYKTFSSTCSWLWLMTKYSPDTLKQTQIKNLLLDEANPTADMWKHADVTPKSQPSQIFYPNSYLECFKTKKEEYLPFKWKMQKNTSHIKTVELLHSAWTYADSISGWDLNAHHVIQHPSTASFFHQMKMWVHD